MDAAKSITATFAINTYALDVTPVGSGTVAKSPDQPSYEHGSTVELSATPAMGYHFAGWSGDATGSPSPLSVTMDAAKSITATFAINTYALDVTTAGSGTVAKSPDQPSYERAEERRVGTASATGYHFAGWSGDATGSTNPLSVTMEAAKSITATFAINTYALDVTTAGSGTVAKSPDHASYDHGSSVELTATPATGYHFVGWSGDATGSTNPLSVTMDAAKSITATFAINTYVLDVTVAGSGTVAKSPDHASYDHGSSVELTATPAVGYHFVGWSGDATGATNPLSGTMDAAKSITATFRTDNCGVGKTRAGSGT